MSIKGTQLIEVMDAYALPSYAMEKDRIGLQIGDPESPVHKVLVSLDVTEAVVDEAIRLGANWIIAHHAVIFQPLAALRTDTAAGRIYKKCIQHEINVFIAHTNLDVAPQGVNDVLAQRLGLREPQVLIPQVENRLLKLVAFIPEDHVQSVREAISEAGAGWIGNYSHCTFQSPGKGTFLPREGTDPFIGSKGKLERVKEARLETIVPERIQTHVLEALFRAHPYEEVAYDLYPLAQSGTWLGLGRMGMLAGPMTLQSLVEYVKTAFRVQIVRVVGDLTTSVQKVAVLGGSGGKFAERAMQYGADVYITGDIDFHTAQDVLATGGCLIDPGHHVESLVVETVCHQINDRLPEEIAVIPSKVDTNPFQYQ